ncbi:MAG TPA: hypothetical protein PLS37_04440 [Propioniciclava tarda]|nr:hypothetical protein [Propioniciclava tarda]
MKSTKSMTGSAQKMAQISSGDPQQTSRYYHDVMRDAIKIVKSSEAKRKAAK